MKKSRLLGATCARLFLVPILFSLNAVVSYTHYNSI